MLMWLTRPPLQRVLVCGVKGFEMWGAKPVFDREPRGAQDAPQFQRLPIGWTLQPGSFDPGHQCSIRLGDFLTEAGLQAQAERAWSQMLGQLPRDAFTADGQWSWDFIFGHRDVAWQSYLFALQVPLQWWLVAINRIWAGELVVARHLQSTATCELPF